MEGEKYEPGVFAHLRPVGRGRRHRRPDRGCVRAAGQGGRARRQGRADHLRRHRARQVPGFANHRAGARQGCRRPDCSTLVGHFGGRPRRLESVAHPLSADRGLPVRQRHRR